MVLEETVDAAINVESPVLTLVKIVLILFFTYLLARVFDQFLEAHFRSISRRMRMEKTSYRLYRRIVTVGIYVFGISLAIYVVPSLRQLSVALLASAGFIGIVIGLAAQSALSNVISGVFLVTFQPFRIGDMIETEEHYGWIEDITLRHTVIRTPANERVVIPNSQISEDYIINYSLRETKCRVGIPVGISYEANIDTARKAILEVADAHEDTYTDQSEVIVKELADSAVVLELRVWGTDRNTIWRASHKIREDVKKRLDEEGINIPFPQRTLSYLENGQESWPAAAKESVKTSRQPDDV